MAFYSHHVLPRLINCAMTHEEATRLRAAHVPAARGVVLEVGIGSGLNLPFYSADVTRVYGVDPSAELLAMARPKAEGLRFPVEFLQQDADRLRLGDDCIDWAVMTWSLCSIADPGSALREVRRVLKPGGALIFVEHGLSPDAGVRRWQNRLTPIWRHVAGGCHLNRKMDDLIRAAGFEITEMRTSYIPGPKVSTYMYEGRATKAESPKSMSPRSEHQPTIRLATIDDAAAISAIYAPYCEASAVSFETVAPSSDEMAKRIRTVSAERPWLVLEDRNAVMGYAYAAPHHDRAAYRWSVSTAIYVSSAHQRRGVGRALYTTLFELLRYLGYFKATAGITLPNPASVGLHEAFGFTPVGVYRGIGYKLGVWHDVAWYEAEVQPVAENPAPPRSIAALKGAPEWNAAVAKGLVHYVDHS